MASKKKAAAAEGKVVMTKSTAKAERDERREAEDRQAAADAEAKKSKKGDPEKADPEKESAAQAKLAEQAKLESEALQRQREKWNASLKHDVMAPRTIALTDEEYETIVNNLDAFRAEKLAKAAKAGGQPVAGKRYLVSDGQAVRVGGKTYNIPAGRHELTPEFMKENFPTGTSYADLAGGVYARRFRFESDEPGAGVARGAGASDAPLRDRDAVVEQHTKKPDDIVHNERKNYLEGKGTK